MFFTYSIPLGSMPVLIPFHLVEHQKKAEPGPNSLRSLDVGTGFWDRILVCGLRLRVQHGSLLAIRQ